MSTPAVNVNPRLAALLLTTAWGLAHRARQLRDFVAVHSSRRG